MALLRQHTFSPRSLQYGLVTGDRSYLTAAVDMGERSLAVEAPECDGQTLLGWVALHQWTGDARHLEAAERVGSWLARSPAAGRLPRSPHGLGAARALRGDRKRELPRLRGAQPRLGDLPRR